MKSDSQIINELKKYWDCDNFVFTGKFVDKSANPNKYCGRIIDIKNANGEIIRNIKTGQPLFFNVKKSINIVPGLCRIECALADSEYREKIDNEYLVNFRLLPSQTIANADEENNDILRRIRKNWKLNDDFFIGQIRYGLKDGKLDKSKYTVIDIRRSDFSKINTEVNIGGLNQFLDIQHYNRYYKFSWKLAPNSSSRSPWFYIDTTKPVTYFPPKAIVDCIHDDIIGYPASASQIIVKTLDTLKNQLTASGKEVFIYELLQNANDYPCKSQNGQVIPVNVEFRLTKNYLIFQHTGEYFSPRNIAAICNINDKEKTDNTKAIGYKGIGFKSVFLDNNYVYLRTGDYSFRFDREDSGDIMDTPWQIIPIWTSYNFVDPEILMAFNSVDSKEYKVQFALRPMKHEMLYESESNYVKLFREVFDTERVLLFIPNIGKVTFMCEGQQPIVRCKDSDKWCVSDLPPADIDEKIRLQINKEIEDGDTKIPEKYKDFSKTTVKFACQVEGHILKPVENTTLYCYLPAKKARLGLPFLMNTDMIPTGPRDDIEDLEVNYEISRIAGRKLCEWLQSLLTSGQYEYDSVFSLVPEFTPVTNYEEILENIQKGFENSLNKIKFIPVLDDNTLKFVCVSNIIYDTTGISESGLFTDSELLTFADGEEWTTNPNEFFAHPDLRGKEHFNAFIEKYHAENMVFGEDQILELCSNESFNEWLSDQSNNNKFLEFLLEHDFLHKFIDNKKEIFIGEDGELYDASEIYYDIDVHLKDLSCFAEKYLPRLSTETREYFKDNEDWNLKIAYVFLEFNADDFVDEVLNDNDMLSLLEDKDNSVSFIHFLAINEIDNANLVNLPFFNYNNELVKSYDRLVFFESERGIAVKSSEWLGDSWIDFISNDYFMKDKDACVNYLKSQFDVLDYSDKEIIDSIIKDPDKTEIINSHLNEVGTALPFIEFINANADEFDNGFLSDFHIIIINKEGEEFFGPAESNTYLTSALYEELEKKPWVDCGWMYSLSEEYFKGKSESEKNKLKSLFIKAFGVKEFAVGNFVDDILLSNIKDLNNNLTANFDNNIDFWRWIKDNCKERSQTLTELSIIAKNADDEEDFYSLSGHSIYMSDSLLPEGQRIESIVKKYYDDALFIASEYAENNTAATKKTWRKFFEDLGIRSEQTELVFDQIIPNLDNIEDPGIPSMLAQAKDFFGERSITISDLTSLRLETQDGEYEEIGDCLFVSTKKVEEPFKDIKLSNECNISHYNADTRALLLEIAEEAGSTIIENIEDWRAEKLSQYLSLQDDGETISNEVHYNVIKEILDIDEKEKKNLLEEIHKIRLIAKDGEYYAQEDLTLGKEYQPLCDFETNGIGDKLIYLSADYANLACEKPGKKIQDTFKIHYRFTENDIDLLSNYSFAEFFWRRFVSHDMDSIKRMIEGEKFKNKVCIPLPNGEVACAEDIYSLKRLGEYRNLVIDWAACFPMNNYPEKTYEILEMLNFKDSLSFEDGLNALQNTEDQFKRYNIIRWMSDVFDESNEAQKSMISEYRAGEKSKWKNRNKKKCFLRDLYALDIDEKANSKYLEQYFKRHPRIILDDYFPKADNNTFYKECEMLQIPIIRWKDMKLDPVSTRTDENIKSRLRNYLLFVAAIEHSENWAEYYNSLCERFDRLSFKSCHSISLTYSEDDSISQTAKKFYYDTDDDVFYYVGEWDDRLVFTDFINELRKVLESEMDRDMFMQIFEPKSNIHDLENFANSYCIDLADDENFRTILQRQLGVRLTQSEYEEDEEEPELQEAYQQSKLIVVSGPIDPSEEGIPNHNENETENKAEDESKIEDENDNLDRPNVDKPNGIAHNVAGTIPLEENLYNKDDENKEEDDDENVFRSNPSLNYDKNQHRKSSISETSNDKKTKEVYKEQWGPAQQDSPSVGKFRKYADYSPDKFKARNFNAGNQDPLTLSRRDISNDEVQYLSKLFGRSLNVDTIKDENYIVRMRFYNSLKENGLDMDMEERDYIENGSEEVVTMSGKYIHRCSARNGILYISPTVWNHLREGRWIICFYSGKMADQFVYIKSQSELMEIINQDALVIQVTGNDKKELVDKIYEDGFHQMEGNIYTLIRTIKVEGEVTPFDENITDFYSDDDDQDIDAL